MAIDFTELFGDYTGDSSDSYSLEDSMNDLFGTGDKSDDYVDYSNFSIDDLFDTSSDFNMGSGTFDDFDSFSSNLFDDAGNYTGDDGSTMLSNYMDNYLGDTATTLDSDTFMKMMNQEKGYEDMLDSFYDEKGVGSLEQYLKKIGQERVEPPTESYLDKILNFFTGTKGKKSKGGSSGIIGLTENMLDNDLIKILLGKKLLDDDRKGGSAGYVPIGQEAYGGGGGQPSYQISNLQPALLPGMAYANQPTTFNNTPPGMEAGGLMAIPQGNKGLPNLPQSVRNNMGYMQAGGVASLENMMDGPGDITQAMLEPGEFVMTRKATENLTPEYLYNLMHQAENAGRR